MGLIFESTGLESFVHHVTVCRRHAPPLQKQALISSGRYSRVVGITYSLETSDDLVIWTDLPGDFVATKTTTIAEVANAVGETKRFWRAKHQ